MNHNLRTFGASVCLGLISFAGLAADLTSNQKDGVCRVSLAAVNGNARADYRSQGQFGDTLQYVSARGYTYDCEVFSEGKAFTLSNKDWGRLKPTGSVTTEGKCSSIKLLDPGTGVTHDLKSCSK